MAARQALDPPYLVKAMAPVEFGGLETVGGDQKMKTAPALRLVFSSLKQSRPKAFAAKRLHHEELPDLAIAAPCVARHRRDNIAGIVGDREAKCGAVAKPRRPHVELVEAVFEKARDFSLASVGVGNHQGNQASSRTLSLQR